MSWKQRAQAALAEVKRLTGGIPDELIEEHYSGVGGAVHPSGKLRLDLPADDVAYETLACHCQDILEEWR